MGNSSSMGVLMIVAGLAMGYYGVGGFISYLLIGFGMFVISPVVTFILLSILGILTVILLILGVSLAPLWGLLGTIFWFFG